jgi:hypothetical protein
MFSRSYQHIFQELFPAIRSQSLPPKAVGKGFPLLSGLGQLAYVVIPSAVEGSFLAQQSSYQSSHKNLHNLIESSYSSIMKWFLNLNILPSN